MRKLDTEQTNWAIEAYHFVNGILDDRPAPGNRDLTRADLRDTPREQIENPFEKLVEKFNEYFGHSSKF